MKKLLVFSLLTGSIIAASAQSVQIRIVSNDGSLQATNVVSLSADKVSGLLTSWNKDSASKTNAGVAAITFNAFILQELTDKSVEWSYVAAKSAISTAGLTNTYPDILARKWFTLTGAQQTNAVAYFNAVGQ